ncbi:hypothetical protein M3612_21705 [Niallia taxi]|uniref:hypothetical protein n=1 Tax=Niallia taxi TaxID=2499688 RepID=UPI00203DFFCE|nr:hypothetical protein [Niallia taxi]MCM3217107.1 hypothetical protein [Niallia taxi]
MERPRLRLRGLYRLLFPLVVDWPVFSIALIVVRFIALRLLAFRGEEWSFLYFPQE